MTTIPIEQLTLRQRTAAAVDQPRLGDQRTDQGSAVDREQARDRGDDLVGRDRASRTLLRSIVL